MTPRVSFCCWVLAPALDQQPSPTPRVGTSQAACPGWACSAPQGRLEWLSWLHVRPSGLETGRH